MESNGETGEMGEYESSNSVEMDVIGMAKRNTFLWCGHLERMESESLTKSYVERRRRGKPSVT